MTDPAAARSGAAQPQPEEALAAKMRAEATRSHQHHPMGYPGDVRTVYEHAEFSREKMLAFADEVAALAAARLAQQQALRDYGQHRLTCGAIKRKTNSFHLEERDGELTTVDDSVTTQGQCDCGLADALKT